MLIRISNFKTTRIEKEMTMFTTKLLHPMRQARIESVSIFKMLNKKRKRVKVALIVGVSLEAIIVTATQKRELKMTPISTYKIHLKQNCKS